MKPLGCSEGCHKSDGNLLVVDPAKDLKHINIKFNPRIN